jgi:hypothetical protein
MIKTGASLTELSGFAHPENLKHLLKPQTRREEDLVEVIEAVLEHHDPCENEEDLLEENERLKGLEVHFIQGCGALRSGIEELKSVLCAVTSDHEKVAHMTAWLFRQQNVLSQLKKI